MNKQESYNKGFVHSYVLSISLGGFLFGRPSFPLGFGLIQNLSILVYSRGIQALFCYFHLYYLVVTIGAFFGAASGYFLIRRGRRKLAIQAAVLIMVASILKMLPIRSPIYHLVIKGLIGVGIGLQSFITPLFIYEIAPTSQRGWLMGLFQLLIVIGEFLAQIIEFSLNQSSWFKQQENQFTLDTNPVISLIIFFPLFLVSLTSFLLLYLKYKLQTPRFYLQEGSFSSIKVSMLQIYKYDEIDIHVQDLIKNDTQKTPSGSISDCLKKGRCKGFWMSSSVLIFQQICGINAINLQLFKVGDASFVQVYYPFIVGGVSLASLLYFLLYFHQVARKIPLVMGMLLMASCEISLICFLSDSKAHPYFTYTLFFCFVFLFQLSLGPIGWIQVHQILEPRIAALASALNWLFNFLVTFSVYIAQDSQNSYVLTYLTIFFGSTCLLGAAVVMFCLPETNGKNKDQIHKLIYKSKHKESNQLSDFSIYE